MKMCVMGERGEGEDVSEGFLTEKYVGSRR